MPKKAKPKTTEPETKPAEAAPEAAPEAARGTKTAAIKAALKANPKKGPKAIAELLQAEGWEVKPQHVSVVKSAMKAKQRGKAAPVAEVAPVMPKDAVSLALLQKAKKLAAQLGGIQEAKAALAALAQLMD